VKAEISKKLKIAQGHMKQLGMERETPEKQSAYLLDLATQFQKVVSHALEAKYSRSDLFDKDPSLKLATAVTSRNASFGREVEIWGPEYQFASSENINDGDDDSDDTLEPSNPDSGDVESSTDEPTKGIDIRKVKDPPELDDILYESETLAGSRVGPITQWLKKVYQSSRGFELGTFDPSILATTMKKQSSKWPGLALGYVSDIVAITHNFIKRLLSFICTDDHVTTELLATLADGLVKRYIRALDHARFILNVERMGTPITLNRDFTENLENW
jgi:hypothetical protein